MTAKDVTVKRVLANNSQRPIALKSVVLLFCVLFLCSANAQNASTAKDLLSSTNYQRYVEVMNYLQEAQVSQAQIAASEMLNAAKQQNCEIDQPLALHLLGKVGLLG